MSMTQIIALRGKRAQKWDAAKAFLTAKTGADGTMAAEDAAAYDRMEAEVVNLGDEIARLERQQNLDEQLNQPTSDVLHGAKPGQPNDEPERPRATDAYRIDGETSVRISAEGEGESRARGKKNYYTASSGLVVGKGRKIPLWLFGFLY